MCMLHLYHLWVSLPVSNYCRCCRLQLSVPFAAIAYMEERKQDMVCPVIVESVRVLRTKITQPTLSMLDTQLL